MTGKSDESKASDRLKQAVEKLRGERHRAEPNNGTAKVARDYGVISGKSAGKQVIHYPKTSSALRQYAAEARKEVLAPTTRLRVGTAIRSPAAAKATTAAGDLAPAASPVQMLVPAPISPSSLVSGTRRTAIASVADLGSLVRRQRRSREITQEELAMRAGTGRRFVSDLESGKPTIEFGRLLAVCAVLGISLAADGGGER